MKTMLVLLSKRSIYDMHHRDCILFTLTFALYFHVTLSKLADRARWVHSQRKRSSELNPKQLLDSTKTQLPLDGPKYRIKDRLILDDVYHQTSSSFERDLGSSQSGGCCANYEAYSSESMCSLYGQNCYSSSAPSHDSGDGSCSMVGLSFIGLSFSVNTPSGNPYSYQLCDQFPMENLIDRNYDYVMSMDEDGWLVGGGYKSFDYSGKMPYIDSSHTELVRVGSLDPTYGGTSIEQVYSAMSQISFPPFSIFPEYVKIGGGRNKNGNSNSVPSGDITLIVSIVETYENGETYSTYEKFLNDLFNAMYSVNGGPCMDDHDTDPHISMARGVKFKSSDHQSNYSYKANLEVAVWQAMYPNGVVLGSTSMANFPPNHAYRSRSVVGYGNVYFFFDRANITKSWPPSRKLTSTEAYYAKLYDPSDTSKTASFYSSTTTVNYDYNKQSGNKNNGQSSSYEHNPYNWNPLMARRDMINGLDLPPNCFMEGETFFGIPLSRASDSKLQTTSTFQNQFDFEYLTDRNYTYMMKFGTNHGWLAGEEINNGPASIVDKDTLHIPIFYVGTTNQKMGGMTLTNMIKIAQDINFGSLYIKPAFVFQDYNDGHLKLQFEADANSALGNLYDSLCKAMGIEWNGVSPYNKYGVYTKCAMHSAGDRAAYGCGPENANYGGFCPQMIIAYKPKFKSNDAGAAFISRCNKYIDHWRSLYPSGVAVGTTKFCPEGGCLGLFLNRYDLYQVFKPAKGGSWVGLNPTSSVPLECDDTSISCRTSNTMNRLASNNLFNKLGPVGKFSFFLLTLMSITLAASTFLARARRRRKKGESYFAFWLRDLQSDTKKTRHRKRRISSDHDLEEEMLEDDENGKSRRSRSSGRSRGRSRRSRSRNSRYQSPSDRVLAETNHQVV